MFRSSLPRPTLALRFTRQSYRIAHTKSRSCFPRVREIPPRHPFQDAALRRTSGPQ
jgi:hypothetical protein